MLPDLESETTRSPKFVKDYLLFQLATASQVLSNEFDDQVRKSGVKVPVWRVLACVADQPGLMLTSLSKLVMYEQSRLTKIIDQMVDEGLVAKRSVEGDRRKIAIFITAKGCEIVTPLLISAKAHEKMALECLTISEQILLKRVLNKLSKPKKPKTEGGAS